MARSGGRYRGRRTLQLKDITAPEQIDCLDDVLRLVKHLDLHVFTFSGKSHLNSTLPSPLLPRSASQVLVPLIANPHQLAAEILIRSYGSDNGRGAPILNFCMII
jgi:hypothetical protein